MSVRGDDDAIRLSGACGPGDAEALAAQLLGRSSSPIDAGACESMHGAVLQVLIAFRPEISIWPADPSLLRLLNQALAED